MCPPAEGRLVGPAGLGWVWLAWVSFGLVLGWFWAGLVMFGLVLGWFWVGWLVSGWVELGRVGLVI